VSAIGVAVCHRTGKSTLARKFALSSNFEFVETSVSGVFKDNGYDPKVDYDFSTRMKIQWLILASVTDSYKSAKTMCFITDRTPIDLMAYLMADIGRQNLTESDNVEFTEYQKACYAVTNKYFSVIVVVQPGIEIVEADGKAPCGSGYMEHINALISGIAISDSLNVQYTYIPRHVLDL